MVKYLPYYLVQPVYWFSKGAKNVVSRTHNTWVKESWQLVVPKVYKLTHFLATLMGQFHTGHIYYCHKRILFWKYTGILVRIWRKNLFQVEMQVTAILSFYSRVYYATWSALPVFHHLTHANTISCILIHVLFLLWMPDSSLTLGTSLCFKKCQEHSLKTSGGTQCSVSPMTSFTPSSHPNTIQD